MPMHHEHERRRLLDLCRAAMPGVAGVVLSTLTGRVLGHEEARVADPQALVDEATRTRSSDTSALVRRDGGFYLVVFVPPAA